MFAREKISILESHDYKVIPDINDDGALIYSIWDRRYPESGFVTKGGESALDEVLDLISLMFHR